MKFYCPEDEGIEEAREIPNYKGFDSPKWFAEEAARRIWDYEDGWEASWPMIIAVVKDGKEIARYSVGMEAVPSFYIDKNLGEPAAPQVDPAPHDPGRTINRCYWLSAV